MIRDPKKIVISRTDSIGDVVLTLPLAGILKERFPKAQIVFLGNTYTKPIIECAVHVDEVWEWAEIEKKHPEAQIHWLAEQNVDVFLHIFPRKALARLARKAGIKHRVGTSHRLYHWLNCNYRPNFTRKRSDLHEAQLNTKLLAPFRISAVYTLKQLSGYLGFTNLPPLPETFTSLIDGKKKNVILHAKSQGSAVEWGVDQFIQLASELNPDQFNIFFTGTEKEATHFRAKLPDQSNIFDLSGKMSLYDLIAFIAKADVLVAASTGPLHIAGITNIKTIGLFLEKKPIHSGRWKPLGNNVLILKDEKNSDFSQPLAIPLRDVLKAVETSAIK